MIPAVVGEASCKVYRFNCRAAVSDAEQLRSLGFAARAVNNEKMGEDRIRHRLRHPR